MYWHEFQCDEPLTECKRGPNGLTMQIRTDWDKKPGRVRCPYCGKAPTYRGSWPATSDLASTMRSVSREELRNALTDILDGWSEYNFGSEHYLFTLGRPFHPVGSVKRSAERWLAHARDGRVLGAFDTLDAARRQVEASLEIGRVAE